MVITKVFQIKNSKNLKLGLTYIDDNKKTIEYTINNYQENLENKFNYIIDSNKTKNNDVDDNEFSREFLLDKQGNMNMVSGYGIANLKYAYDEMIMTKNNANQFLGVRNNGKSDVLAHHIIQSFSPEDNLTPEEVHKIGRRTVLELTGGEHEFIIATHLDKEHLHNHIIFNTTNNVTLRKFRWQKGTKKSLENISDKHADLFGAKIIDRDLIVNHKKYEAYKKQNTFRYELKERLNFLLKHSSSTKDFFDKAKILNIKIDLSGKEIKYKLLDSEQQRYVRDRTLSKNGYYGMYNLAKIKFENNKEISKDDIKELYEKHKLEKSEDFEMRFIIEDWQILEETKRGIYIEVDFGISNKGTIMIPHSKLDRMENGYEAFIKRNDYFYFTNSKRAKENRYIKGSTLSKQLSRDNGEKVIYKNYYVGKIDKLIEELNYLSNKNITSNDKFIEFQNKFELQLEKIENELDRLDSRIATLNKLYSALDSKESENQNMKNLAEEIIRKLKMPITTNKSEVKRLLNEVVIERDILNKKFNDVVSEYNYTKNIEKNIDIRNNNRNINKINTKKTRK